MSKGVRPSLALFAEAIAGHPVVFEVVEDAGECWPWARSRRVGGDVVVVPVELANPRHYRTIVLHQLLTEPAADADRAGGRSALFGHVYALVEDIRIIAATRRWYPGAVRGLDALLVSGRAAFFEHGDGCEADAPENPLMTALRGFSLGADLEQLKLSLDGVETAEIAVVEWMAGLLKPLCEAAATAQTSLGVAHRLCGLLGDLNQGRTLAEIVGTLEADDDAAALPTESTTGVSLDGGTPSDYEESDGLGGGEVLSDSGDQNVVASDAEAEAEPAGFDLQWTNNRREKGPSRTFFYDEWDHHEQQHRSAWCRVIEEHLVGDDHGFIAEVRSRHAALRSRIRRTLMKLPAQELVRVHRCDDGDELDVDAVIEAMADRRSGAPMDDRLHIRRDRAARDVATAFLVDLSASTSSAAVPPEPEPIPEIDPMDDPLSYGPLWGAPPKSEPVRRVIDVAKDAVALMGDALDELGDRYAIYGFSGTGRHHVDFKIGKDFGDRANANSWANVGAMKPLRYTRMGPAVRHAAAKLSAEPARSKFLIVISDGYPQDTDYGADRHDRDYGMHDTARALADATDGGIATFCLTIDPAGHDYLRQMCPDDRYVVIDDVESLPEELANLYLLTLNP